MKFLQKLSAMQSEIVEFREMSAQILIELNGQFEYFIKLCFASMSTECMPVRQRNEQHENREREKI